MQIVPSLTEEKKANVGEQGGNFMAPHLMPHEKKVIVQPSGLCAPGPVQVTCKKPKPNPNSTLKNFSYVTFT